jgi:hypothetical protein
MRALRSKRFILKRGEAVALNPGSQCPIPARSTPLWPAGPHVAAGAPSHHARGAKTKASITVNELPQGVIGTGPLPELEADDAPQYPTVVQGAKNNMAKFSDCVVLTRVGNFYEVSLHRRHFLGVYADQHHGSYTLSMQKNMPQY